MKAFIQTITNFILRMVLSPAYLPIILLLAATLRVWWIYANDPWPVSDFEWYYQCAINLVNGAGYRYNGEISAFFAPGYPVFLALLIKIFGASLFAIKCSSVLLQVATVYLVYRLGRRLTSSEAAGRFAMLLMACYPNQIAYSSIVASENLFLPLMLLGTELLLLGEERPWALLPAGLTFGYAALTRPHILLVPIVIFIIRIIALRAQRPLLQWLAPVLAIHLLIGLVLSPWLWFTYKSFGHPVMTTSIGHNLWIANNPNANGTYVDVAPLEAQLTPGKNDYERDQEKTRLAKAYQAEHPNAGLALVPARLSYLYTRDDDGPDWNNAGYQNRLTDAHVAWFRWFQQFSQGYYLALAFLFFCALLVIPVRQRLGYLLPALPIVGLCIMLYFTMVHLTILGMFRYHIPMMPWVMMTVGALLASALPETNRSK